MLSPVVLYGFDARLRLDAEDPQWTQDRRERYLLRPDLPRVLSVDRLVWPAVPAALTTDGLAPDYFSDLGALRRRCDGAAAIIALAVSEHDERARALEIPCQPAEIDPAWRLLGWDVADSGLISGLSNCGFLPDTDVTALRRDYGPRLNEHGLFRERADAEAFRTLSDARVKEHAPFFVHRILLVEER
ncbi:MULTISPECIES: hypothetical protein [Sorangium]|uniref:Uncharacterized protein n=1 Tax=Sorangium cellulosum (strain So ce56) TaxID=448385 RepID=A9FJQ3_SORC5|nr:hypothetical protein [Sorangium cellulosum]CAN91996.1 hypothetical protein predicted by Glimmer/Critica [Sorangium cellulosum So ce56]